MLVLGQLSPYGTVTGTDGTPQPGPSGGRAAIPGTGGTGWGAGGGGGAMVTRVQATGMEYLVGWCPGIDILLVSQNPSIY